MIVNRFLILFFFSTLFSAFGQISPNQMIAKMGRGINIGNLFSATKEGNWAPPLTKTYLDDIKSVGFKTVRIPMDFYGNRTSGDTSVFSKTANTSQNYTGNEADYSINSNYLDRIEEIITWSLNRGLVTILDVHGHQLKEEFLYTFSPKDKWAAYFTAPTSAKRAADNQKFRSIWKQIANRFKNFSENLIFEIVNEPYFFMTADQMDILNADIISIIRNSGDKNTKRNIIITGGSKNAYEAPLQISENILNSNNYLIATFHYYKPREFTASSDEEHNTYIWGTSADKTEIDTHFNIVKNWSNENNIPILLGEFGADNANGYDYSSNTYSAFGGPEESSRVAFHKYLADKAIELGFAFTAWDAGDQSNKTIYKVSDRSWVTNVRNALLGTNCLETQFIENADIECGHNNAWSLFVQAPADATKEDANISESRAKSNSLKINITTAGATFNRTILKNKEVDVASFNGNSYNFSVFARGSNPNQQFKIRIKSISNTNTVSYNSSSVFNLENTNYTLFSFNYTVPVGTSKIEYQIICGKKQGNYFFDDFFVTKRETLNTSTVDFNNNEVNIFPNPSQGVLHINSKKKITNLIITDIIGKTFYKNRFTKKIDTSNLPRGLYILKLIFNDSSIYNTKFLKSHNQ